MKNYLKLFFLLIYLFIGLTECQSKKKDIIPVDTLLLKINSHAAGNDLNLLIDDYFKFPKYSNVIKELILFQIDPNPYSVDKLNGYAFKAKDDTALQSCIESLIVDRHQKQGDVKQLIIDSQNYKSSHDVLTNYLLYNVLYDKKSYKELCDFSQASQDDSVLFQGFKYKILSFEDRVLDSLFTLPVASFFGFYSQNEPSSSYLTQVVNDGIIGNISSYNYKKLRTINILSEGTDIHPSLSPFYNRARTNQKASIKKSLDNFKKSIDATIKHWNTFVTGKIDTYIANNIGSVISDCGHQEYSENKEEVKKKFFEILDKYISFDEIETILYSNLPLLEQSLNQSYNSYLLQVTGDELFNGKCKAAISNLRYNGKKNYTYDLSGLYKISEIQNESDPTGTLLGIGGFVAGLFGGPLGLIATAASAAHSYDHGKNSAEREGNALKTFSNSLIKDLKKHRSTIINNIRDKIFSNNNSVFKNFERLVYENY